MAHASFAIRDEASLNVLIPMGGRGEVFREAGYVFPKPLIKIAGRPMLFHMLDNLQLRLGDVIWLVVPHSMHGQYEAEFALLQRQYPAADIRVVTFKMVTRGAVETLFIGLQHMSPAELSRKTLCLDCDNLYFSDVLGAFRTLPRDTSACFYFTDRGTAAIYSYLRLEEGSGAVLEVAEKVAISDHANVGAYGFASGSLLHRFARDVLDDPRREAMHYYVSNLISRMLDQGRPFVGLPAEQTSQCGTPTRLEAFIDTVAAGRALGSIKRRFCFALDDVLVTHPQVPGDFSTVKPIERNIQLVRELKAAGHYIIVTTSRLMLDLNGNVGAVIAACGNVTLQSMAKLDIPYDEIHFGQPNADLYVDRAVACASVNAEKDIGWRLSGQKGSLAEGVVAARHFNEVQISGDLVIKTAATSVLRGEMFFYSRMPADIADLFPRLLSSSDDKDKEGRPHSTSRNGTPPVLSAPPNVQIAEAAAAAAGERHGDGADAVPAARSGGALPAKPSPLVRVSAEASGLVVPPSPRSSGNVSSMTLQRVSGVTFSHLVTSRCLTPGRLRLLLSALRRLHSSEGDPASLLPEAEVDLGANYLPKLRKRYSTHESLYKSLCPTAPQMHAKICSELELYMATRRFRHARVIHGDPVFSNVLLTDAPSVFLLDMRGEVGSTLTLQGDMLYDLSKVYQSLLGYDFIILNQTLNERDAEILEELRGEFAAFVAAEYADEGVEMHDVVKLTASHYFGIVPLHQNQSHRLAYLETCKALLSSLPP